MIGCLPKSLEVDGVSYPIRSDFRTVLLIIQAFNDAELSDFEKSVVCLECLYEEIPDNVEVALEKAVWFIDGGSLEKKQSQAKVYDWEQDESIIFSAINKVAGFETREKEYMHWWTFLGYFCEIGEGAFSSAVSIRSKIAKGKKLEKYEKDFLKENKELITLKEKKTPEQIADEEYDNKILKELLGQ